MVLGRKGSEFFAVSSAKNSIEILFDPRKNSIPSTSKNSPLLALAVNLIAGCIF
jgi:hypothetical protein